MFFIAPGPLTFDLFERGFDRRLLTWLGVVLLGTGIAGLFGKLPGCEPAPYIIRFTEDRPNPLYRRICYTDRVGRSGRVRGAERGRTALRDSHRRMAAEADVRMVLLSDRRHHVGARRARQAAARQAFHGGRRATNAAISMARSGR